MAISLMLKPGDELMTLVVNSMRNDIVGQVIIIIIIIIIFILIMNNKKIILTTTNRVSLVRHWGCLQFQILAGLIWPRLTITTTTVMIIIIKIITTISATTMTKITTTINKN